MLWLILLTIWVGVVALVVSRFIDARRRTADDDAPAVGVTLSVLPDRTAVIALERGTDACSGPVASLVEDAVKDAFNFETVDAVEVRSGDGQLLERTVRPPAGAQSAARRLRGAGP